MYIDEVINVGKRNEIIAKFSRDEIGFAQFSIVLYAIDKNYPKESINSLENKFSKLKERSLNLNRNIPISYLLLDIPVIVEKYQEYSELFSQFFQERTENLLELYNKIGQSRAEFISRMSNILPLSSYTDDNEKLFAIRYIELQNIINELNKKLEGKQ